MELPAITIPDFIVNALPLDSVPTLLHPPLVHFAIVIPIIVVLLELINIILKRNATPEEPKGKAISTLSFFLIILMVVIFAAAYISGSVDGKNTWDVLGEAGQSELKEHKLMGTYLVYASIVLLVFKIIAFMGKKGRVLFLLLAILFAAATLKQGKDGGELVYEYGANVAKVTELDDEMFDLKDELDTLKGEAAPKAEAPALEDSVTKKEAAALADPKATEGEAAAKAKVEETESKDQLEAKETSGSFEKESAADVKKELTADKAPETVEGEAEADKEAAPSTPDSNETH